VHPSCHTSTTQQAPATEPCNWREHLPVHPAADAFPKVPPDELITIGNDIRKHGLRFEIVVRRKETPCKERYHDGFQLLDGRTRLDAMAAIGLKFEFKRGDRRNGPFLHFLNTDLCGFDGSRINIKVVELPEEEIEAYVASANLHRRHLNAEQKRERIADVLKAKPELSDRAIGRLTNTDHKTVSGVRSKANGEIPHKPTDRVEEANSDIPNKTDRIEASGRKARGRKPATRAKSAPKPPPKPAPQAKASVPITESPEVSIEQRQAEHAALDQSPEEKDEAEHEVWLKAQDEAHKASAHALDEFAEACRMWLPKVTGQSHQYKARHLATKMTESGAGAVASGLGLAIQHDWLEAERAFEALAAHTITQLAQAIPPGKVALVAEIADYFAALAAKLTARSAGNGKAPAAGSDCSIPVDPSIPTFLQRGA
jgi:hypothetical protein